MSKRRKVTIYRKTHKILGGVNGKAMAHGFDQRLKISCGDSGPVLMGVISLDPEKSLTSVTADNYREVSKMDFQSTPYRQTKTRPQRVSTTYSNRRQSNNRTRSKHVIRYPNPPPNPLQPSSNMSPTNSLMEEPSLLPQPTASELGTPTSQSWGSMLIGCTLAGDQMLEPYHNGPSDMSDFHMYSDYPPPSLYHQGDGSHLVVGTSNLSTHYPNDGAGHQFVDNRGQWMNGVIYNSTIQDGQEFCYPNTQYECFPISQ